MVPEPTIADVLEVINGTFLKLETQMNQGFNDISMRFNAMNLRFNAVDARLDSLDTKLSNTQVQMGSLLEVLAQKKVISQFEAARIGAKIAPHAA